MHFTDHYSSPLGIITLACDGERLTGLWFEGQRYFGSTLLQAYESAPLPLFDETRRWLDRYFAGKDPGERPPLHLEGSPFRQTVWNMLQQIPYGTTVTYGEMAREIARRSGRSSMSAQAVGNAIGRNPISILVPCHRVVGSDGKLTGYAGGIHRKAALLRLEGYAPASLCAPSDVSPNPDR